MTEPKKEAFADAKRIAARMLAMKPEPHKVGRQKSAAKKRPPVRKKPNKG
jgi:hypothetical protein